MPHNDSHASVSRPHLGRREFLGTGSVAAFGSLLARQVQAGAARAPGRTARSVIMIFNCGAPSHIDLWDPKPLAPDNVRGPYKPIDTAVPGIHVSSLLPELAKRMDRLSLLRTLHHRHGAHNAGMYWSTVGRPYRMDSTLINPSPTDYPSFGTLVGWLAQRDGYSGRLPPYVITPFPHCDSTVYLTPGQYGGCLGVDHDPFVLNADPNDKKFRVQELSFPEGGSPGRLQGRLNLLSQLSRGPMGGGASPAAADYGELHGRAASMLLSGDAARAFDLSQEPDAVRERYGRHSWGQSHLLARRLIEAGVKFVSTVNGRSIVWDTHEDNFERLEKRLVRPMETAFVALLDDLQERGLLEETLVIWIGDFGRTPIINKQSGRDHWPQCYTVVVAGGGLRTGQTIGVSDRTGASPKDRPITPADLHATVFTALGYDPHGIHYHTVDGRPTPLSEGEPIAELLG